MVAVTPSDARVFVLDVGKHARLVGRKVGWIGACLLLTMGLFQVAWWQASLDTKYPDSPVVCAVTLVALVGALGVLIWTMLWSMFSSYRLLLGPDWVATDSGGRFRQQVNRSELERVCELPDGLVLMRGGGLSFRIPRSINGYDAVRSELLAWAPLATRDTSRPWLGLFGKSLVAVASVLLVVVCAVLLAIVNVLVKLAVS